MNCRVSLQEKFDFNHLLAKGKETPQMPGVSFFLFLA